MSSTCRHEAALTSVGGEAGAIVAESDALDEIEQLSRERASDLLAGRHVQWRFDVAVGDPATGVGMTAGSIGLTPGGLGVVEAALSAALVAAGMRGDHALTAVVLYRLISFWLVMIGGWAVLAVLTGNTRFTHVPNQPAARGTTTQRSWAVPLRGRSSRP